jgi:hypothetical protein
MANGGGPPDPKATQAWVEGTENVRNLLAEIVQLQAQVGGTTAQAAETAQSLLQSFNAGLQVKIQEAEMAGKINDLEQRRQFINQQQRAELQAYLTDLTLTARQRQTALETEQRIVESLNNDLQRLRATGKATSEEEIALRNRVVAAEERIVRLNSTDLSGNEQIRQSVIQRVAAQTQLLTVQEQTAATAQRAMSMLLGLDNKWRTTFMGALTQQAKVAMDAQGTMRGLATTARNLAASLRDIGSLGNVMGSTFMKVQETTIQMVKTIDQSDVSLRAATGASKQFATGLTRAFEDREIRAMGASIGEVSQMQQQLYSISRAYSGLLPDQRMAIDRVGMAAKRSGIAFGDFATVVDKSTRIFGDKSAAAMSRLVGSARAIGETPARMVKSYIQSLNVLAQYSGPEAIKVLQGLTSMAKATGIEINRLTGIAARFDTFDSAATSVAKLNAIMGGPYFNTVQMLYATESQRLRILQSTVQATNMNWDAMDRWQRKAMAAAAGFQSLEVAAAFYRGNMAEVKRLTEAQEQQVMMQQQLIRAAHGLVPMIQQLTRLFQDFGGAAKTILPYARRFVAFLSDFGVKGIIATKVMWSMVSAFTAFRMRTAAVAMGVGNVAAGTTSLGIALRALTPALLIGGGALYYFLDKLREKKSPMAAMLPQILAQGVNGLANASEAAVPGLSALINKINLINSDNVIRLSQALAAASRIASPELNFQAPTNSIVRLVNAVNLLDNKKIQSFSMALGQLGHTMRSIPRETVIAVTQLTRASRDAGGGTAAAAAAGRTAARVRANAAAIQEARAAEPEAPGMKDRGILVTDRIQINMGGAVFEQSVEDVARGTYRRMARG